LIEHALETADVEFAAGRDVARRACGDADTPRRTLTPVSLEAGLYPE
jgi:hypothetical protein